MSANIKEVTNADFQKKYWMQVFRYWLISGHLGVPPAGCWRRYLKK